MTNNTSKKNLNKTFLACRALYPQAYKQISISYSIIHQGRKANLNILLVRAEATEHKQYAETSTSIVPTPTAQSTAGKQNTTSTSTRREARAGNCAEAAIRFVHPYALFLLLQQLRRGIDLVASCSGAPRCPSA